MDAGGGQRWFDVGEGGEEGVLDPCLRSEEGGVEEIVRLIRGSLGRQGEGPRCDDGRGVDSPPRYRHGVRGLDQGAPGRGPTGDSGRRETVGRPLGSEGDSREGHRTSGVSTETEGVRA